MSRRAILPLPGRPVSSCHLASGVYAPGLFAAVCELAKPQASAVSSSRTAAFSEWSVQAHTRWILVVRRVSRRLRAKLHGGYVSVGRATAADSNCASAGQVRGVGLRQGRSDAPITGPLVVPYDLRQAELHSRLSWTPQIVASSSLVARRAWRYAAS